MDVPSYGFVRTVFRQRSGDEQLLLAFERVLRIVPQSYELQYLNQKFTYHVYPPGFTSFFRYCLGSCQ
jgi:hypothetical protein